MLFNSFVFLVFFAFVFPAYWYGVASSRKSRNLFLIATSYLFYGWWDWRFLGLIIFSSLVDFGVGIGLERSTHPLHRKRWLWLSLAANLGVLGTLKYFGFFADTLVMAAESLGFTLDRVTTDWVLPVGISFYTLQTLSYTIDVYLRRIPACRDPGAFFAYVCFFPQLVAGPIERAQNLLPQFSSVHAFDFELARDAMRLILWGAFKKIVVADTCGLLADPIFADWTTQSGATLALACVYFGMQVYGDFSGYSDIAIGLASLLGFRLLTNFDRPYFATSIAGFWKRWHISLSSWFRDYVYIPLGGNRKGRIATVRNLWVVFTISGLWHGASWNYVIWGWLHFLYLTVEKVWDDFASRGNKQSSVWLVRAGRPVRWLLTIAAITFAWAFFRLTDLEQAFGVTQKMLSPSLFSKPDASRMGLIGVFVVLIAEGIQRDEKNPLQVLLRIPTVLRWSVYLLIIVTCLGYFREQSPFIYFQF